MRAIHALDKELPVFNVRSVATELERGRRRERLVSALSSGFGGLAVLLAGMGIYGVIAYAVARRTREIGIRVALGARRSTVVGMVLRDTLRLVLLGMLVGLPLAYAGGRLVTRELHGLTPHDPGVAVASVLLIALVGLLAGALPAWRAAHLEPLDALRQD